MNTPESWEIPGGGNGEWDIHNVFTPSSFCRDSGIKISETQRKTQIKKQDFDCANVIWNRFQDMIRKHDPIVMNNVILYLKPTFKTKVHHHYTLIFTENIYNQKSEDKKLNLGCQ